MVEQILEGDHIWRNIKVMMPYWCLAEMILLKGVIDDSPAAKKLK
ncbi:hypothetical protein COLO4_06014 [Corchorus olitorius]|uniref:Uncharacterized protein n=1 Tax=Corchorus olitorius TaxID=93759 RepID=A0A1R3KP81_9ROSI|nr:hypothetical protein COLO4_06014 [Corchorus olitorius]